MFATFLIGTVLVTCLVMVALLAMPTQRFSSRRSDAVPLIGAGALALAILLAAITGLAVSA